MTKQKEIREGIAQRLRLRILGCEERTSPDDLEGVTPWSELDDDYKRTHWLKEADQILSYLHSQGVVIKVGGEPPWRYETCKCCTREQRLAWWVRSSLWESAVIPYYENKTLCLECFLRMADDKGIDIKLSDISIEGKITRDKGGYVAVEPLIKEEK